MKRVLSRSVAVLRAIADVAEKAPPIVHACRALADAIADELSEATPTQESGTPTRRRASTRTPTVEFSEVDIAKADRQLLRLGVRKK